MCDSDTSRVLGTFQSVDSAVIRDTTGMLEHDHGQLRCLAAAMGYGCREHITNRCIHRSPVRYRSVMPHSTVR
jgi:hypothetical protein